MEIKRNPKRLKGSRKFLFKYITMANIDEIKKKIKEDGFEYLVEVPCYWSIKKGSIFKGKGNYYLCAKAIGNTLFYKIVDESLKDYPVERISDNADDFNAQFQKGEITYYFKMPNM